MRVLIIDDDRGVRRLLGTVLERDGYQTVQVEDAENGWLRLMGEDLPQLLILDRMLPDMDGADFLARVRNDPRTADLPVLMLTAAACDSKALSDGALTRVLAKPFDLSELREL